MTSGENRLTAFEFVRQTGPHWQGGERELKLSVHSPQNVINDAGGAEDHVRTERFARMGSQVLGQAWNLWRAARPAGWGKR